MCALRDGYPQKLENYMITQNLLNSLGVKLSSLVCAHPTGTHVTSFAGTSHGKLDTRSSQRWLPELCDIIVDSIEPLTPKGGPSFQVGCDDIADLAIKSLQLRDAARCLRTAHAAVNVHRNTASNSNYTASNSNYSVAAAAFSLSAPYEDLPPIGNSISPDVELDARPYSYDIVMTISAGKDGYAIFDNPIVTRHQGFDSPYIVMVSDGTPADDDSAPQTDRALALTPDRSQWEAADQQEIDTLMLHGDVLREVISNGSERTWTLKFVRKKKKDAVTLLQKRRSRLVCVGSGHVEGREFDAKSVCTPMFSTNLTIIVKTVVLNMSAFSFDLTQFFQMTPCHPPGGPIYGVPPKNFRKHTPDGKLILWVFNKWLQGARGAGNATRKLFESYIMTNGEMNFERSVWDPSLYFYHDADGTRIEFTLHGDDGTGCANSITAAHRMKALLESKYPGAVKWWDEHGDMLGFAVKKTAIGTTITAPKHIEALHVFVTNDAAYKPTVPYTKDFMHLLPVAVPEPDTVEWHLFDARVHFMQESGGHIAHITKVRPDIVGAYNMVVRTSHAPCSLALKCMKHLIFYLITTISTSASRSHASRKRPPLHSNGPTLPSN